MTLGLSNLKSCRKRVPVMWHLRHHSWPRRILPYPIFSSVYRYLRQHPAQQPRLPQRKGLYSATQNLNELMFEEVLEREVVEGGRI